MTCELFQEKKIRKNTQKRGINTTYFLIKIGCVFFPVIIVCFFVFFFLEKFTCHSFIFPQNCTKTNFCGEIKKCDIFDQADKKWGKKDQSKTINMGHKRM